MKFVIILSLVLNSAILMARNTSSSASPGVFQTELFSICKLRLVENTSDYLKFIIETRNNGANCLGTGNEVTYFKLSGKENIFVRSSKKLPNSPLCKMQIEFESPVKFSLSRGKCENRQASSHKVYFYKVNT
ncbi:hypothetical protein N9N67_00885 [Bacteriovoracaceae bacterium]|nr:hypothetical protein [Bacteriovoracaceae bacterium]